jgi:hypothetical protein
MNIFKKKTTTILTLTIALSGVINCNLSPSFADTNTQNTQNNSSSNNQNSSPQRPWWWNLWHPPQDTGAPAPRHKNGRQITKKGGSRGCELAKNTSGDNTSSTETTSKPPLTTLVPNRIEGRTNSPHPTLFFYLPYDSSEAASVQLTLVNFKAPETAIYTASLPEEAINSGIIGFSIPNNISLERGEKYYWILDISCQQTSVESQVNVSGAISLNPIEPSPALMKQLETATPKEKIKIYAQQGWWYDALAGLVAFRCQDTEDIEIISAWNELLKAEKLEDITQSSHSQISKYTCEQIELSNSQ